jgi:hypothetical protein
MGGPAEYFERTCDDDSAGKKFDGVSEEQLSQLIATLKRILDFELDEAEVWGMKAGEVLRQGPAQADDRPLDQRELLLCSKGQNALRMAFASIPILLGWHVESGFAGLKRQFTCSCTITSECDSVKVVIKSKLQWHMEYFLRHSDGKFYPFGTTPGTESIVNSEDAQSGSGRSGQPSNSSVPGSFEETERGDLQPSTAETFRNEERSVHDCLQDV